MRLSWIKSWWIPPNLEAPWQDHDHNEALSWALDYVPNRPNEADIYKSALKYAERHYDQAVKLNEALDKKLDDVMKIAGTLGTLIATAARFVPDASHFAQSLWFIPALGLIVIAAILAVHSRGPTLMAFPMPVKVVLEIAERMPSPSLRCVGGETIAEFASLPTAGMIEGVAAASYNYARAGTTRANIWKSTQVRRASGLFAVGVFLLLTMLVIETRHRDTSDPAQQQQPAPAAGLPKS